MKILEKDISFIALLISVFVVILIVQSRPYKKIVTHEDVRNIAIAGTVTVFNVSYLFYSIKLALFTSSGMLIYICLFSFMKKRDALKTKDE